MGGGGSRSSGSTTTVQKADPWSGVQPYLTQGYGALSNLYMPNGQLSAGPQYYPGQTVATPSYWENYGNNLLMGNLGGMQGLADYTGQGAGQLIGTGGTAGLQGVQKALAGADQLNQVAGSMYGQGADAYGTGFGGLKGNIYTLNDVAGSMYQQGTGSYGGGLEGMRSVQHTLGDVAGSMYNQGSDLWGTGQGGAIRGMNDLLGAGDVQNNPYFQSALSSAMRPVTEQFNEQVLPGIRQGAAQAGQFGGSRQGIAEGIASRGYLDTLGDIATNMGNAGYAQGLNAIQAGAGIGQGLLGQGVNQYQLGLGATGQAGALSQAMANMGLNQYGMGLGATGQAGGFNQALAGLGMDQYGLGLGATTGAANLGAGIFNSGMESLGRGVALGPTAVQGMAFPGQLAQQVGQQQTADQQQLIDAEMQRWNYNQQLPYSLLSDYLGVLQGASGGQTSSTQQGGGGNRLMSGLGGAATGYGLASALFPGFGWAGALGGGLLGLF